MEDVIKAAIQEAHKATLQEAYNKGRAEAVQLMDLWEVRANSMCDGRGHDYTVGWYSKINAAEAAAYEKQGTVSPHRKLVYIDEAGTIHLVGDVVKEFHVKFRPSEADNAAYEARRVRERAEKAARKAIRKADLAVMKAARKAHP